MSYKTKAHHIFEYGIYARTPEKVQQSIDGLINLIKEDNAKDDAIFCFKVDEMIESLLNHRTYVEHHYETD